MWQRCASITRILDRIRAAVLFGQTSVSPAFEVASLKEALPLSIEHIQGGEFHVGVSINGARADYGCSSPPSALIEAIPPTMVAAGNTSGRTSLSLLLL
jgi:hypothetical protein